MQTSLVNWNTLPIPMGHKEETDATRDFLGELARDPVPGGTTLLKFRHLLERHQLTESLFNAINADLAERGLFLREGTIRRCHADRCTTVDQESGRLAGSGHAPEQEGQAVVLRDEGAHRRGCGFRTGTYRLGTASHVSDISQAQSLLHGEEVVAFGDVGYQGGEKREEYLETPVTWQVAHARANGGRWTNRLKGRRSRSGWNRPRPASAPRSRIRFMW